MTRCARWWAVPAFGLALLVLPGMQCGYVCADGLLEYTYSGRLLVADGSGPAANVSVGVLSYDTRLAPQETVFTQQPLVTATSGPDGTYAGGFTGSSLGGCGPASVVLRAELDRVFVYVQQGSELRVLEVPLTRDQQVPAEGKTHISLPDIYVSDTGLSLVSNL